MASEVGSTLLLFIAAVGVAALAGGVMAGVVNDMASELRDRGGAMADALATDVAIVNDPDNVPYDAGADQLTVYVKNTGTATLAPEDLLVLVDGQAVQTSTQLLEGAQKWHPQGVLEVTVTAVLATGDHSVHVSYQTVSDRMSFRV